MNQPGPGLFKIPSAEEKPSFGEFLEEPRYFASHQSINQSINQFQKPGRLEEEETVPSPDLSIKSEILCIIAQGTSIGSIGRL